MHVRLNLGKRQAPHLRHSRGTSHLTCYTSLTLSSLLTPLLRPLFRPYLLDNVGPIYFTSTTQLKPTSILRHITSSDTAPALTRNTCRRTSFDPRPFISNSSWRRYIPNSCSLSIVDISAWYLPTAAYF